MIQVTVTGAEHVQANLRNLATTGLPSALDQAIGKAGQVVLAGLKSRATRGVPRVDSFWGIGGAAGNYLHARTGMTARRVNGGNVLKSGNVTFTSVGSPDKYMKAHEEGGEFSSGGGWFRLPTAASQIGSVGVERLGKGSFRDFPGGFLFKSKAGNLWGAVTKGRKLTLLYLFKKHIKLPGRHIFAETVKETTPQVNRAGEAAVTMAVRSAND